MSALEEFDLLDRIITLKLLEGERLDEARQVADRVVKKSALAEALVEAALLTRWQSEKLLAGETDLRIDRYVLLDALKGGGMGSLFRARQAVTNSVVALKTILDVHAEKELFQKRFDHEIQALARLNHLNIVGIIDAGRDGERRFLIMPLVEGTTLAELAERDRPMPVEHACEYCRQAAVGLQHAHEQGVVHRDIKPANLMVTWPAAERPLVRIVDFGIAHISDSTRLTDPGVGIGSRGFAAPEQWGDPHGVDIRADIYSLGMTLLFLLTGEKLNNRNVKDLVALKRADVPSQLIEVLARMLAFNPDLRYDQPEEVAAALAVHATTPDTRVAEGIPIRSSRARLHVPTFHATGVVPPEFFIDRERERALAMQLIASGQGFLVVGKRRAGKTSFCKKLMDELRDHDSCSVIPTYVNLVQYSSLTIETFLEHTILNALGEIGREVFNCDWALLKEKDPASQKPSLAEEPEFGKFHRLFHLVTQRTHSQQGSEPAPFLAADFVHFTRDLLNVTRSKGYNNLVVFFDEANRLSRDISVDLLTGVEEALHDAGLIGVYAASQDMADSFEPLRELFGEEVHLGPFDDIKHLYRLLSRYYFDDGEGRRVNELPTQKEAVELMWTISEAEPYLIQHVAQDAFRRAHEAAALEVHSSHVSAAFHALRSRKPHLFRNE